MLLYNIEYCSIHTIFTVYVFIRTVLRSSTVLYRDPCPGGGYCWIRIEQMHSSQKLKFKQYLYTCILVQYKNHHEDTDNHYSTVQHTQQMQTRTLLTQMQTYCCKQTQAQTQTQRRVRARVRGKGKGKAHGCTISSPIR